MLRNLLESSVSRSDGRGLRSTHMPRNAAHYSPQRLPNLFGLVSLAWLLGCAVTANGASIVHEFYLPMPEAQIRQAYGLIETNLSNTLDSAFSVVITGGGTIVYYDQWEDGYEVDLAHPTQASTQIWGDGN